MEVRFDAAASVEGDFVLSLDFWSVQNQKKTNIFRAARRSLTRYWARNTRIDRLVAFLWIASKRSDAQIGGPGTHLRAEQRLAKSLSEAIFKRSWSWFRAMVEQDQGRFEFIKAERGAVDSSVTASHFKVFFNHDLFSSLSVLWLSADGKEISASKVREYLLANWDEADDQGRPVPVGALFDLDANDRIPSQGVTPSQSEAPRFTAHVVQPLGTIEDNDNAFSRNLSLIKSDFDHGLWWRLDHARDKRDPEHKRAYVTVEIGWLQNVKRDNPLQQRRLVQGDDDFLIESTYEVMDSALYRYHELTHVCECVVQVLHNLRAIESLHLEAQRPFNLPDYFLRMTDAINPRICYIFLLYWTYLRVKHLERPDELRTLHALLNRYMLFRILAIYPRGINQRFVKFHKDQFPPDFQNRYWQFYEIKKLDTIKLIVDTFYHDVHWPDSFQECVRSLKDGNEILRPFAPEADLTSLAEAQAKIQIVPPRDYAYQQVVAQHGRENY